MKKFILIQLLTISSLSLFAQKEFMKFGKIPLEDLEMKSYAADTNAGAVILGDFGTTRFNITEDEGFTLDFTRHTRIKILDKSKLEEGNFTIRLYVGDGGDDEDLNMLKGFTYNLENGNEEKSKLEKSSIFTEMEDKNHKLVKFSMPNVKVGSVIDITYSVKSPFLFNLQSWRFQSDIPVVRSEYHVYVPEYFHYKNWISGYVNVQKETSSQNEKFQFMQSAKIDNSPNGGRQSGGMVSFSAMVNHWSYFAENVPAFIPEPHITTLSDYLGAVEFELMSYKYPWSLEKNYTQTWNSVSKEMMDHEDFGGQINRTGQFSDIAEKINSSASDSTEKVAMAYNYIKNRMTWDGRYRLFTTTSIKKAFNDGQGTSSEINLNLIALLRELNFEANPIMVSTRSNGKIRPGLVILTQFNHVIAGVKIGKTIYPLDATDPMCPYYMLPPNTLNGQGLLIDGTNYKWIDLNTSQAAKTTLFCQLQLNDELALKGSLSAKLENYAALKERKDIKKKTDIKEYTSELEDEFDGAKIDSITTIDLDSSYKPLKINADIEFDDKIMAAGDKIYFTPILVDRLDENPFKKENREYPVDYNYPFQDNITEIITLPEGYKVEELPQNTRFSLPNNEGEFTFMISNMGNKIMVKSIMNINQTIYPSTNYPELKKFYEMVVKKMAEQVVLTKI